MPDASDTPRDFHHDEGRAAGGAPGPQDAPGPNPLDRLSPAFVAGLLSAIVAGLAAMNLGVHALLAASIEGYWLLEIRDSLVRLFEVNGEGNIPAWYSSSSLLACAFLLARIAADKRRTADPFAWHWIGLAVTFLCLSIDEAAAIHEMAIKPIRSALGTSGFLRFAWIIPGSIAVAIFALAYLRFLLHLSPPFRTRLLIAGALFVGGAIGMEAISGYFATIGTREALGYVLVTTLEEAGEMSGVAVLLHALLFHTDGAGAKGTTVG